MGKRISVILIVVLAAAAVTFGVLWQSALRDHSDANAYVRMAELGNALGQ